MTRPRYAEIVRRLLRGRDVAPPPALPADRRRLIAAVEEALRARARRRARLQRAVGVSVGVAAAVAFLVAARGSRLDARRDATSEARPTPPSRALTVLGGAPTAGQIIGPDGTPGPAVRGVLVDAGIRLVAPPSGDVTVGTADGTQLTLGPRGDLAVLETGRTRRFALRAGVVSIRVGRLVAGERFVIDTTDAAIDVHGSALNVALVAPNPDCGGGARTRVTVSAGDVSVRAGGHEVRVAAGEQWPAGCAVTAHLDRGPGRATATHRRRPAAAAPPAASAPPVPPASSLAVENDLFAEAVRTKNAGQLAKAAQTFGLLIDAHPKSPLVESAMVQRMRLLATVDRAAGVRLAQAYLARFPAGVARPEAERLAATTGP